MLGKVLAPLACLTLAASPALAQSTAAPLSVARAAAPMEGASEVEGSWLPPVLAALIVVGGVLLATGVIFDDDNDLPTSP